MPKISRRHALKMGSGLVASMTILPSMAWANEPAMRAAIADMFGKTDIQDGRIKLTIPTLSESGYSVAMEAEAESPMTEDNYVRRIAIFSEKNPIPLIADYHFTPLSGRARIASNIRLGGTQHVHAIAEMSDGSLWGTSSKVFVTLAACVVLER